MSFMSTGESGANSLGQFVHRQRAVRFEDATLGVEPLGFNGIEPGTLDGQRADQQANALSSAFDQPVVFTHPLPHGLAAMPGGVTPNHGQTARAERLGFAAQPVEEICGEDTDGSPVHKAQPDLLRRSLQVGETHQETITGQGLRLCGGRGFDLLNQAQWLFRLCPGVQLRLLKATPPGLVFKTQQPLLMRECQAHQPVTRVFLRPYAGSGLVIQSLARCQRTPKRSRALRTVSSLTRYVVKPCSRLTSAASSSVQTLLSFPYWRGLSCNIPFRRSAASSLKALCSLCGRLERRSNTPTPRSLKARITSRTVSSSHPSACARA